MPKVHSGPTRGLFGPRKFLFQQLKHLLIDLGGLENPLEPAQHGG